MGSKVIVTCLYPRDGLSKFDKTYYIKHHVPNTIEKWQPLGMTDIMVSDPEEDSQYVLCTIMTFEDMESWKAATASAGGEELTKDIENFTNVKPEFIVGKLLTKVLNGFPNCLCKLIDGRLLQLGSIHS